MEDFEEYKKQGEPEQSKKAENWGIAIGLQKVDNLTPSKYLIKVAKENIEGRISVDEAEEQITSYYKQNPAKTLQEHNEKEADEVSARINRLLSTNTFSFSPAELISIHKALFTGILDRKIAGKIRDYDITKDEPILNGDTVVYGRADSIKETLDYDFTQEKNFNYKGLSKREKVEQLAKFTSGIWQIHPFGEGNTRATAVFIIKYLYTLGFKTTNDMFEKNAKYFRNALVRANYQNLAEDIPYTMEFLNKFFGNLLLGEKNLLDNREMQIKENTTQKIAKTTQKDIKTTQKILSIIKDNPKVTRKELAILINISPDGIKWNLDKLKKEGKLHRVGPDKGGHWEVIKI